MPHVILSVVYPKILKVFCLLGGILKASKEYYVVLLIFKNTKKIRSVGHSMTYFIVGHAMSTSRRWPFRFSFYPCPFSSRRLQPPKVAIVIKRSLFW